MARRRGTATAESGGKKGGLFNEIAGGGKTRCGKRRDFVSGKKDGRKEK